VRRIVSENYERAKAALTQHREALQRIADELLTREVLDGEQVKKIVAGEPIGSRPAPTPAVPAPTVKVDDQPAREPAPAIVNPLPNPIPQGQ